MALKLLVVGSNQSTAQELEKVVVQAIGSMVEIELATYADYAARSAEMLVCFSSREKEFVEKFGANKLISLTRLSPASSLSKLPRLPLVKIVPSFLSSCD